MNEILTIKNTISSRVNVLKWKYLIIGGSIVVGFILAEISLVVEMIKVATPLMTN